MTITGVNDGPVAVDGNSFGAEDMDIPVNLDASDVDGTVEFLTIPTLPDPVTEGTLFLSDGTTPVPADTPVAFQQLIFRPVTGFDGDVPFEFTVTDDDGAVSAPATQTIQVGAVNDPPVAVDDIQGNVFEDDGNTGIGNPTNGDGLLSNDSDADGDALTVTEVTIGGTTVAVAPGAPGVIDGADGGTFTVFANGLYQFNPDGDFEDLAEGETETSSFTYTISDGKGGTDTAKARVTITGDRESDEEGNRDNISGKRII